MSQRPRREDLVSFFRFVSSHRALLITAIVMLGVAGAAISRSFAFKENLSRVAAPSLPSGKEPAPGVRSKEYVELLKFAGFRRSTATSSPRSMLAPTVTATKTDALFTDVDGDLQADPGDTLKYTVTINASGEDATGVTFTDTVDPNTAFVPGSLTASPVAVDDSYVATGNVRISVPAPGVLGNDFTGVPAATLTAPSTSANGGDVVVNANGSFTYNPPAGFEGTDTFVYTLTNGSGFNTATVTINVSGMIWFINNAASCPCDGRLTNPFNSLASFQAVNNGAGNNPAPNDNIFVYESAINYVGPVILLNGQRFIGQDATASLSSITGLTPPSYSDPLPATNSANATIVNITSAGAAITVGSGNSLIGFTGGDAGTDISGTGFGTLTVADVRLNGLGQALDLTSGTLAAAFISISSTDSATTGISLTSVGGTLTSGSTTVNGSDSTGVSLLTNTAAITFGSLAIAPDANQRGLLATDNSGVITSSGGAITTSGAIAVQITRGAGTTPLAMSQTSVSANGGTNGIVLTNTSGSFTVAGDGSLARNGSGGTITAVLDDGIALTNASNVTLQSMNLTNNGDTAPTLTDASSITGDHTVQISGGSGVVLSGVLIQNPTGSGIVALNLSGTNRINSDSRITQLAAGQRFGIYVENVNTNMTLFEFKNSQMIDFSSSASAFFFVNTGTSNMTLDVKGSTFEDLDTQALTVAAGGTAATTGTLTSIIGGPNVADRNFFQNAKGTGENNAALLVNNGALHVGTIQNNLFDNIAENGTIANTSIIRTQNSGGRMTAVVEDNTVQNITYPTAGRHIIGHIFEPIVFSAADFSDLRFEGNTVTGVTYAQPTNREFVFIDYRPAASGGDIKILNNNFNIPSADAQQLFELRFRQTNASTVDLLVDGNTGTGNTTAPFLDIDSEAAATVNATVTNNNFTKTGAGQTLDLASETATASLCANISGNTLSPNTITLNEAAGNMTVTQASAAAVAAANGGATVTVLGSPTFGAAACSLPMNALMSNGGDSENLMMSTGPDAQNDTLFAERNEGPGDDKVNRLSPAALSIIVQTAISKWQDAGISAGDLARLRGASFEIADLPEGQLASTNSGRIVIDQTGAGYGWFYDLSPADDLEFELPVLNRQREALESSTAYGQMDLLSAVMRQLGSLLTNKKVQGRHPWLMQNTLAPGIRRAPVSIRMLSKAAPVSETKLNSVVAAATPGPASAHQQVARLNDRRVRALKHHATITSRAAFNSMLADVMLSIGTLPAGESVTITFNVTVDNPFMGALPQVSNQGTVSGTNFADVLTDDPSVGGTADPTVTPIDLPSVTVAVSPTSVLEDGATNLVYTFTRNGSTANAMTVNFSVGGTASFTEPDYTQTGAATFTATSGTVVIPSGSSTATVTVDPSLDLTVEPDETVVLTVTSGVGYNVGSPSAATGTITNDDTSVSVAVSPGAVAEDGVPNLVYTFTRTGVISTPLAVDFTVGGTATFGASPNDYTQTGATAFTSAAGVVTFTAGSSTATVIVDPETDSTVEPDETVILTVIAGVGYTPGAPASATGTITNDDTDVTLAVSPGSVAEDGATNLVYTFTRNGVTSNALTVNFTVAGTASFPGDYSQSGATSFTPPTGTVTFAANSSTATVTIDPIADSTVESDETVVITLASGTGYNVATPGPITGTITNDDTDVTLAVSPGSVAEDGATNLVYTFTRNGVTNNALTVNFTVAGSASFPGDYSQSGATSFTPPTGTVTFAANSSTATVTIDPIADTTVEGDETVDIALAPGAGYNVGSPSAASGTITNDDTDVSIAVAPASVAEDGATNLVYTFTRNGVTSGALTVNFSVGGTASFGASPNDYTQTGATTYSASAGSVTFAAMSSTATVIVNPETDTTIEADETVILTLAAGTGYNVSSPSSATGTIANDDADVSVAVAPASVAEDGATNLVYTFTRTGFTAGALTVNFSVGGTAVFGPSPDDYTQTGATTYTTTSGSVTFAPGSPTATVTVDPEVDLIAEADETVVITLTAGASYNAVSPNSATGTILNDDTLVSVVVAPSSTAEGGANLVYTFSRTGPTTSALAVNFSVGGTASFPGDYTQSGATTFTPPTATVTFGAGSSTATVTVTPLTDCIVEGNETVDFTVQPGAGYGVGSPSAASGTITNTPDSTAPTITLIPNVNMTLWPPNHQYESIAVTDFVASASDDCDPSVNVNSVYIVKITSDEPENGGGDGNTLNDIVIGASCKTAQLRAERAGNADGRVYNITFKASDSAGNFTTATTSVTVRKSPNKPAVDSGTQYTVNSVCP